MTYIDETQALFGPTNEEIQQMGENDLKHGRAYRPGSVFSPIQFLTSRHTYFDNGKWRIKIKDTEYSDFPWIDRLAAFEDLGLEPAEVQRAYDNCVQFLNAMDGISLSEVQEYAKAKKEGRLLIPPNDTNASSLKKQFCKDALSAYRNNEDFFVCPICHRIGSITRHTDAGITAQCLICEKAISISFSDPTYQE